MIVLVCGGRDFTNRPCVYQTLTKIHKNTPIKRIVCGGARGADRLAADWALDNNVNLVTYNADWKRYQLNAGPKRNQLMLDREDVDLVVAFPGNKGTANMMELTREYGIPLKEVTCGS